MCLPSAPSGNAAARAAEERRREQAARQARITEGTNAINDQFALFDDDFFEERENDFVNFQMPQLQDQMAEVNRSLGLALASAGQSQSSLAGSRRARVQKQFDRAQRNIFDRGRAVGNQARGDIENSRSNLISQLNATADPASARSGAARQVALLSQQPAFDPIGEVFSGITDGIATAAVLNPRSTRRALSGLFNSDPTSGGSGRVVT